MLSTIAQNIKRTPLQYVKNLIFNAHMCTCCKKSRPTQIKIGDMQVKILPILEHNYMYMIVDLDEKKAVAIDPAVPELIYSEVEKDNLCWRHTLITHHHDDHQAGNKVIREKSPDMKIWGSDDRISCLDKKLKHFDVVEVGNMRFRSLDTPGHTKGHSSFFVESIKTGQRVLFAGDLLFCGGVGPLAEGTAQEMYHSLQVLYSLPNDTRVFGGHEFTIRNLELAKKIEPKNPNIINSLKNACKRERECLLPMLTTIGEEKKHNPFFRLTHVPTQKYVRSKDPYEILEKLVGQLYFPKEQKEIEKKYKKK